MNRIAIIGATGSGKSTFARTLSKTIKIPYTELDALHWRPNWTNITHDQLLERVESIVWHDQWIIEGGYSFVQPAIWSRADTVIWLDYSFSVVLRRLLTRTIKRIKSREMLWGCNQESWAKTLSADSILIWLFKSYWKKRRQYSRMLAAPEYSHIKLAHFKQPADADGWLLEQTPR